jgi:hypothetical protein
MNSTSHSGYWAKLVIGKAPKQPPLPEPRPGDPLEWTRDGTLPKRARSLPRPPQRKARRKRARRTPNAERKIYLTTNGCVQ